MEYTLAIDIGASSGRHILGWQENGEWQTEEIYRFPNFFQTKNGHDCWDIKALFDHILIGMKKCSESRRIPATVAIDTWGVDYVLLDDKNQPIGDAIAYRDARTQGMDRILEEKLPFSACYAKTGIAKQPYNTLYQLMSDFREHPEYQMQVPRLIFMPCYLSGLLCGKMQNEYTIASTSGLLHAVTKTWDIDILSAANIPIAIMGDAPAMPGTVLGNLLPDIAEAVGYTCKVLLTACHDTASAFFAMPVKSSDTVCISSGTWSLLGTLLPNPILTNSALRCGFTNEGGIGGIRFLKNIMGLWMLQRIRSEWNQRLTFSEMAALAEEGTDYRAIVDATSPSFLNPPSMIQAILDELAKEGHPLPANDAELLFCINRSLAVCYAQTIQSLQEITGVQYKRINIIGGGCNNKLLNRLTEIETGLPVLVGPAEATALGNLMAQSSN